MKSLLVKGLRDRDNGEGQLGMHLTPTYAPALFLPHLSLVVDRTSHVR